MNDNEDPDRQWWRDFINILYLAIFGVAICIVVAGLMGMAYAYWGLK